MSFYCFFFWVLFVIFCHTWLHFSHICATFLPLLLCFFVIFFSHVATFLSRLCRFIFFLHVFVIYLSQILTHFCCFFLPPPALFFQRRVPTLRQLRTTAFIKTKQDESWGERGAAWYARHFRPGLDKCSLGAIFVEKRPTAHLARWKKEPSVSPDQGFVSR